MSLERAVARAEAARKAGRLHALRASDFRAGDLMINPPWGLLPDAGACEITSAWLLQVGHHQYEVALVADGTFRRLPDAETKYLIER